jgi:hypothetical protein
MLTTCTLRWHLASAICPAGGARGAKRTVLAAVAFRLGALGGAAMRCSLKMPGPAQAAGAAAARLGEQPRAGTAAATAVASRRIES